MVFTPAKPFNSSSVKFFSVMTIILLFRPSGLLGRKVTQEAGGARLTPVRQLARKHLAPFVPYVIAGIILIVLPPVLPSYLQSMLTKVLIFGILALSLNLLFGYTGLFSLGHAAYFAVGGYTAGILAVRYGIESFWLSAPAGILMAVLIAAIFGRYNIKATIAIHISKFNFTCL